MFAQENNEIAITKYTKDQNAVNVRIKLMGDFKGEAILSFPQNTVLSFVKSLTEMEFDVIDEMAYSIVSEITNIICGNVATQISSRGLSCDIDPPTLLKGRQELNPKELFCFTTNQGQIAVTLHIAA